MVTILIAIITGGAIGAKLLFIMTSILNGTFQWKDIFDFKNGFVVFGGILLGIIATLLVCKIKNVSFLSYADIIMPSVAFAQAFGRIGCFMAGCCYGRRVSSHWGVVFPENSFAPSGIRIFPIQLCFSLFDLVLFVVLVLLSSRIKFKGGIFSLYLLFYSAGRFVLEFFRGDVERGKVGILSTSQFVSLIVFGFGIVLFFIMKKTNKESIVC